MTQPIWITVPNPDELYTKQKSLDEPQEPGFDYVDHRATGPLSSLVWLEARRCMRRAKLSPLETAVIEGYLHGQSDSEIAASLARLTGIRRSKDTIRTYRLRATDKLRCVRHKGALTILYETFVVEGRMPLKCLFS